MKKSIWVIDDDAAILEVICIILEQENFECVISKDAHELLKLLPKKKPALILLDVLMSGIDGREIATTLKSDPNTQDIPIILMTADIHAEDKAKEARADDFIKKPFDIDVLIGKVKKYTH
jgi:CheY-like chemotaxis protein